MGASDLVLAIDQGTTSTRAILFDSEAQALVVAQEELSQHYPALGWVEHDPEEIWKAVLRLVRQVLSSIDVTRVSAIGIANQRETIVVWDRNSGEPIYPAIVWQDRRTSDECARLKEEGVEALVRKRTGLVLDPYFSASKIAWILDHVPRARERAERGELACGTIESFLLWRLTGGSVHLSDATNAARTSLFDIRTQRWDPELCRIFRIPDVILPEVRDNSCFFAATSRGLFEASIPIAGMAGDQQAALFGQACFAPGMVKSTYGTGCFMLVNTGEKPVSSQHRLLTTPAYRLGGRTTYALEGSIFVAGAAIKWLRDGLGVIAEPSATHSLATQVEDSHGVYMVPAFVGLGAPYWDPEARGAIFGLTLGATGAHLARAALEAVAYQTRDLLDAVAKDAAAKPTAIRIDGAMSANSWFCQFLADILDVPVQRPMNLETTALGAAFLAGLATRLWSDTDAIALTWRERDCFKPDMVPKRREALVAGWQDAVKRTLASKK